MVERMISDILKWLIIILIFFIAFACSLFLIFSHFAVSLEYHRVLNISSNVREPRLISPLIDSNSTSDRNPRCPLIFYNLTDQLDWNRNKYRHIFQYDELDNDTCSTSPELKKIRKIGPYPAVYYFGRSFTATTLTTFFTLFGVIAEDNIPVDRTKRKVE